MQNELEFVKCSQCGEILAERLGLPTEQRTPCPTCGSLGRFYGQYLSGEITPRSMVKFKARHENRGKPFAWGKVGSDLYRKTGQWRRLERVFDRLNDWYREHISDRRTGKVIKHLEEPLSQHRGHGSAKKSRKKMPDSL